MYAVTFQTVVIAHHSINKYYSPYSTIPRRTMVMKCLLDGHKAGPTPDLLTGPASTNKLCHSIFYNVECRRSYQSKGKYLKRERTKEMRRGRSEGEEMKERS